MSVSESTAMTAARQRVCHVTALKALLVDDHEQRPRHSGRLWLQTEE